MGQTDPAKKFDDAAFEVVPDAQEPPRAGPPPLPPRALPPVQPEAESDVIQPRKPRRRIWPLLVLAYLAGASVPSGIALWLATKRDRTPALSAPPTSDGSTGGPEEQPPEGGDRGEASDWAEAGNVAYRVDHVRIQRPVVMDAGYFMSPEFLSGKYNRYQLEKPELMVWMSFANRSTDQKIDSPGSSFDNQLKLTDQRGNTYRCQNHWKVFKYLRGYGQSGPTYPGDAPTPILFCFERPVSLAGNLRLSVKKQFKEDVVAAFDIPQSVWEGTGGRVAVSPVTND